MSDDFSSTTQNFNCYAGRPVAILGGGQLGRMTAMAARTMGYRVRVMDPEAACPASFVVDETIVGRWDDVDAARRLATGADAVTLEIEQIGVDALSEVARSRRCGPAWSRSELSRTRRCRRHGSRRTDFLWARFAWCEARRSCRGGSRPGRTRVLEDRPRRLRRARAGAHRD